MRHYRQTLRERGEILDVHREVDRKHELAAVTAAAMRRWNKPILFHRVAVVSHDLAGLARGLFELSLVGSRIVIPFDDQASRPLIAAQVLRATTATWRKRLPASPRR